MQSKIAAAMVALTLGATPMQAKADGLGRAFGGAFGAVVAVLRAPGWANMETEPVMMRRHTWRHSGYRNQALRAGWRFSRDPFPGSIVSAVTRSALAHGVPPALAHGVVRVESGYRCGAANGAARGIMQVQGRTAAGVGVRGDLRSCSVGLEAGMRYLRQAYVLARGNLCAAASLYNTGLGGTGRCGSYGRRVIRLART